MKLNANGTEISIMGNILDENSYISLTDIAKQKDPDDPRIVISNWMSSYSTIDFLATWENLYNPSFKALSQNIIEAAFFYTIRPKQKNERT